MLEVKVLRSEGEREREEGGTDGESACVCVRACVCWGEPAA